MALPAHHHDAIETRAEALPCHSPLARPGVAYLNELCRDLGVDLLDADLHDLAGVLLRESDRWKIYLNREDTPSRRRYTLARLLGHFALHAGTARAFSTGGFVTTRSTREILQEREAVAFAAALLVPRRMISDRVTGRQVTDAQVRALADDCGVSPLAVALRLERLGYVVPPPAAP